MDDTADWSELNAASGFFSIFGSHYRMAATLQAGAGFTAAYGIGLSV